MKIAAATSSSTPACLRWLKPRVRRDEMRTPRPMTANRIPIRNLVCSTMCIPHSPVSVHFRHPGEGRDLFTTRCDLPRGDPGPRRGDADSLAGQTLVIIGALQLDLAQVRRVVRL